MLRTLRASRRRGSSLTFGGDLLIKRLTVATFYMPSTPCERHARNHRIATSLGLFLALAALIWSFDLRYELNVLRGKHLQLQNSFQSSRLHYSVRPDTIEAVESSLAMMRELQKKHMSDAEETLRRHNEVMASFHKQLDSLRSDLKTLRRDLDMKTPE